MRPIAVSIVCLRANLVEKMKPFQLGFGVKGGVETDSWSTLVLELIPLLQQEYRLFSNLHYLDEPMHSKIEFQQGDPLVFVLAYEAEWLVFI